MFEQWLPLSTSSCPAIVELSLYFQFRSYLVSVRVTHIVYGKVASVCGWTRRSWDLIKWPGKEAIAASYSGVKVRVMAFSLHWTTFSPPAAFKSDLGLISALVLDATSRSVFFQTSRHWHGNNLSLSLPQSLIGFHPFGLSLHLSFRL